MATPLRGRRAWNVLESQDRLTPDPLSRMVVGACGTAPREACREAPSPLGGKCNRLPDATARVGKDPVVDVELFREKNQQVRETTLR